MLPSWIFIPSREATRCCLSGSGPLKKTQDPGLMVPVADYPYGWLQTPASRSLSSHPAFHLLATLVSSLRPLSPPSQGLAQPTGSVLAWTLFASLAVQPLSPWRALHQVSCLKGVIWGWDCPRALLLTTAEIWCLNPGNYFIPHFLSHLN